ncbi:MAG: response regulator [Candidatus Cloacimonetes bacterium]|nr:response regulator [Candidatus Cloacimonadota bacterium]
MNIRYDIYNIPDLIFTEETKNMPLDQWNIFIEKLDIFVTSFPVKEAKLKTSLENKDYDSVFKHLLDIVGLLKSVYALEMAYDCQNQIKDLNKDNPQKIESYISFLLSNISSLSIDIQMALYGKEEQNTKNKKNMATVNQDGLSSETDKSDDDIKIKNIIAVDDEAYCLFILKSSLRHLPCNVIAVNSAAEALKLLEKIRADLFILDIDMPDMDGIELAEKLITDGHEAPIVFLTGNAKNEYVHECLKLGASDFIVKPIYPQNVAKRIQRFL